MTEIFVGCAGWSLRKELADWFPSTGTHLERYSNRFNAVEINSSFYRPHRQSTYVRWAESTPESFRFAVKMPKQITHLKRLVDVDEQVDQFLSETSGLGDKLGMILVQLPPSLALEPLVAESFFTQLRRKCAAPISCEPRHRTWFEPMADELFVEKEISRVAADPAIVPAAADPGGCDRVVYFRWHGSPRIYYSTYDDDVLRKLSTRLVATAKQADDVWCIFDNTAEGEATRNAIRLNELLRDALSPGGVASESPGPQSNQAPRDHAGG